MKISENIRSLLTYSSDVYATHQPALIWALENTEGDVLELGMGDSSTVLLHEILKDTERKLVSVEDDTSWAEKFIHLKSANHELDVIKRSVNDWKKATDEYAEKKWGVVFVDQGYGEEIWRPARNYSVSKLMNSAEYVVAHDADLFDEMKSKEYSCFTYYPTKKADASRGGPPSYIFSKKHELDNISITEP